MVENLIPRDAYHVDETGYWKRLPFVSGLIFALGFSFLTAVTPMDDSKLLYSRSTRAIFDGVFGGVFFGMFFPLLMRRKVRRLVNDMYDGKPSIDVPPPPGRVLYYRLPCSLFLRWTKQAGGALYLGRDGILFVPNQRNRSVKQVLEMVPLKDLTLRLVEPPSRNFVQRVLMPRALRLLQIGWPGGTAEFLIPNAPQTSDKLIRLTESLQVSEA